MPQRADNSTPGLGIKLIDVPAARVHDPRALAYIVDHLNPGTAIRRRVKVSNASSQPQHIEVYPAAASVVGDVFTGAPGRTANDLSGWISLDAGSLDLPAGHSANVTATIAVPATAPKGERYAAIWAQISKAPTADNAIGQVNRVGVRLYLDIGPGGEQPTDFDIGALSIGPGPGGWPVVTAQVHNTGGRALDMTGSLTMSNGDGGVNAGPFKATTGVTILPGTSAPVTVVLDRPLPDGTWNARLTLASGTVERSISATFTLPVSRATRAGPAALSRSTIALLAGAAALVAVLLALLTRYVIRRRRRPLRT